ncbi:MAG: hypothetical protein AVDCRST_MAG25-206 [uncultured Rubrobacteraceae bacterium]|uniref:Uncharacterized protein n=1 Tax=uncultured Rubrobacteraceae bacterium TaxID=349277 RepID=A0A6J4R5Y6_9ACTN|nr:MAG: hypothetical protein AVDCRST_MAG25-206 [uncultured Rubrobacteraceae bacterium]
METIEATPTGAGYPLRKPLQDFRGIHSGHYRIIWRLLTVEEEPIAEVVYVGIRSEATTGMLTPSSSAFSGYPACNPRRHWMLRHSRAKREGRRP